MQNCSQSTYLSEHPTWMNGSEPFVSFPQELHHKINPLTLSCRNLKQMNKMSQIQLNIYFQWDMTSSKCGNFSKFLKGIYWYSETHEWINTGHPYRQHGVVRGHRVMFITATMWLSPSARYNEFTMNKWEGMKEWANVYLPTLTPWPWISRLRVESFALTPTHAYEPISHA